MRFPAVSRDFIILGQWMYSIKDQTLLHPGPLLHLGPYCITFRTFTTFRAKFYYI